MSLTTCSKEHCWDASLDNGWCNKHTNERIAQLEAENERLKKAIRDHKDSFTDSEFYTEEDEKLWAALEGDKQDG